MRDRDLDPVGVGLAHGEGDGDVNVYRGADGGVILAPASFRRLSGAAREGVQEVQAAAAAISAWQQRLDEAVAFSREEGVSWDLLGLVGGHDGQRCSQALGNRHLSPATLAAPAR